MWRCLNAVASLISFCWSTEAVQVSNRHLTYDLKCTPDGWFYWLAAWRLRKRQSSEEDMLVRPWPMRWLRFESYSRPFENKLVQKDGNNWNKAEWEQYSWPLENRKGLWVSSYEFFRISVVKPKVSDSIWGFHRGMWFLHVVWAQVGPTLVLSQTTLQTSPRNQSLCSASRMNLSPSTHPSLDSLRNPPLCLAWPVGALYWCRDRKRSGKLLGFINEGSSHLIEFNMRRLWSCRDSIAVKQWFCNHIYVCVCNCSNASCAW